MIDVRMSMAPPPMVVIEFDWQGTRLTTTVQLVRRGAQGTVLGELTPPEDEWVAHQAHAADGTRYHLTAAIGSGESVVRVWEKRVLGVSPRCAMLRAMRPVRRPCEVPACHRRAG